MQAAILTIGDEILIGQIVDTNSAWISARLDEVGISVLRKMTVGDRKEEILAAIDENMRLCDIVLLTGGLGPTKDDITKHTLAERFGCALVRHQPTFDAVRTMLEKRGIEFNELNQSQALVPECCTVLPNQNGTAPGMWFEQDGKVLVSLPGVPFEMEALMRESVLPKLMHHFQLHANVHKTAITFGLAESVLAASIAEWENTLPDWLHLAYLPSPSQIRLRLSAYDVEAEQAHMEIDRRFEMLQKIIPSYFIGFGDETVASVTARLLTERKATLAIAESCTGGALSARFTSMAGASEYFKGGVIAYDNEIKKRILGVRADALACFGAVSRTVAEEMAEGVRKLYDTDYALATTGIAGPGGGSEEKPVGTVWIAVAGPQGVFAYKMTYGRLRAQNIDRATASAVNLLRLLLIDRLEPFTGH